MRWRAFIPAMAVLAAGCVFALVFLDSSVKWGIERAGSRLVGARVELDKARVKVAGLAVVLEGLRVADPDAPMSNALEIETIEFDLAARPLFWRKFIIEKARISGIRTGTPRSRSGALPKGHAPVPTVASPKGAPKAPDAKAEKSRAPSFGVDGLREKYDPDKLKPQDLASWRKAGEETARIEEAARAWEKRVAGIEVTEKAGAAEAFLEKVREADYGGEAGARRAAADLEEAKRILVEIKRLRAAVAEAKTSLGGEIAGARAAVQEVDELRKKDLASAIGELSAGGFSAAGIARSIVGPEWPGRLEKAVFWIRRIRAALPAGEKGKDKPSRPPRSGKDIAFPFKHAWPVFHLKDASVSGITGGAKPVAYRGTLRDAASHPKLAGRPLVLEISGSEEDRMLSLAAELDYTGDKGREKVDFRRTGLDFKGMKLGDVGGEVEMSEGRAAVAASLEVNGSALKGKVDLVSDPARLTHRMSEEEKTRLLEIIHSVLARLNRLEVTVLLSGELDRPSLSLRSNLDGLLKGAVDQMLKDELDKLKARYRARIEALAGPEREKLHKLVEGRAKAVTGKLDEREKVLGDLQARLEQSAEKLKSAGVKSVTKDIKGLLGK